MSEKNCLNCKAKAICKIYEIKQSIIKPHCEYWYKINEIEICSKCGYNPNPNPTNLELALNTLEQLKRKSGSLEYVVKDANKMAEQFQEAIKDAVENERNKVTELFKECIECIKE